MKYVGNDIRSYVSHSTGEQTPFGPPSRAIAQKQRAKAASSLFESLHRTSIDSLLLFSKSIQLLHLSFMRIQVD